MSFSFHFSLFSQKVTSFEMKYMKIRLSCQAKSSVALKINFALTKILL
jgi:hypothetical protein